MSSSISMSVTAALGSGRLLGIIAEMCQDTTGSLRKWMESLG